MANDTGAADARLHKQVDAASYDATASAFDQLSERFSAPIADTVLDLAAIGLGDAVLDIGTGAGLCALRAAALPGAGQVLGVDHSAGMLETARAKAQALGLDGRCTFAAMDAEGLDLETASFDRVVSLFVLLHLPNPQKGLEEIHRVLRPGGRVVIGVGGGPTLASVQGVLAAGRRVTGALRKAAGRQLEAPAFLRDLIARRGLTGPEHTHDHHQVGVADALARAGFGRISTHWAGSAVELTPEEFWTVQAVIGSSERVRLAELRPDQVEDIREEFMTRAGRIHEAGGRLVYRFGARLFSAVR